MFKNGRDARLLGSASVFETWVVPRMVRIMLERLMRCAAQKMKSDRSAGKSKKCRADAGIAFTGGVTAARPGRGA